MGDQWPTVQDLVVRIQVSNSCSLVVDIHLLVSFSGRKTNALTVQMDKEFSNMVTCLKSTKKIVTSLCMSFDLELMAASAIKRE